MLERDEEPSSPGKTLPLGMRGLNAGSVETFYRRGMLEALLTASGADGTQVGADPGAQEAPAPRAVSHRYDLGGEHPLAGRIRYAAGPVRDDLGFGALLIRPDGIVAWTGGRDADPEAFRHAAARWFGDPTP